ncbi:peptidoglycan-binding protein LysM [Photobacterium iliopiscarium]|jgi:nucleoid-associated protein YgaU|uniref:Peptidoglycan-binding protein LysM n=1 Tax=Photobacterium iliopiscarium TaxID=56192 RepID=A0A2T3MPE6_9GAMM|nr:peptidoglycan-binding protein LysM [Photobacterium iliopiscarium]KJG12321.1 peptidoglycan-binding protein LysM [Photobacterium iliopiscarium]PST95119.1 peptidoglycan-binding protein LysM [Photobacterium iliopiscarium]PSU01401.1 peptidoglycan-binding protein LysM [Photobacterium iliopiscarium]PSV83692.1 peptidoglycan-binding protein LysM [Photobacterium iliopiscarium]PSV98774.1 peptidoglycan-binding protein LysM [Photobacterium iliopiscarium]
MGLLDFARDIGHKLFSNEDEAPTKITQHIEENNPGISDLQVSVEDGVATLSGSADSAAAREKAILMAGNTQGIASVVDNISAPEETSNVTYYVVEEGDSLWKIAEKTLGNGAKYEQIFEENKEVIQNPDLIFAGQKLRITQA